MRSIESKCPHCGAHIVLKYDPELYAPISDPLKLVNRSCCNRCNILKNQHDKIIDALEQLAHRIRMCDDPKAKMQNLREKSEVALKAYVRIVCDRERLEPVMDWDEGILDAFVARPKEISEVIAGIWSAVKHVKSQQKLL